MGTLQIFTLLGALGMFLYGMNLMSSGLQNPAAEGFSVSGQATPDATAALYGLSMLHTLFNTINTLILIWFTKYIEKAVMWMIKTPKNQENEVFRLKYISAGPLATPELATEQAFDEIIHFAEISRNGLRYVRQAIQETDGDKFEELRAKLVKYEEISDRINNMRTHLRDSEIEGIESTRKNYHTSVYYIDIVNELEKMGDFMINISQALKRVSISIRR